MAKIERIVAHLYANGQLDLSSPYSRLLGTGAVAERLDWRRFSNEYLQYLAQGGQSRIRIRPRPAAASRILILFPSLPPSKLRGFGLLPRQASSSC